MDLTSKAIDNRNSCVWLYRLLNKKFLLKEPYQNTSHVLDSGFYNELLYILGLKEEALGKKVITRLPVTERQDYSILELVIDELNNKFDSDEDDFVFEQSLELVITWLNRVLFIKLLETQLINWHPSDKNNYKILTSELIPGYDWLNQLFFNVLARPNGKRSDKVKTFAHVPYLNSSLFEESPSEQRLNFTIGNIIDGDIEIYPQSVLRTEKGKKYPVGTKINSLLYLFQFLDAYDFGLEDSGSLFTKDSKTIIDPSVLGLLFEKINGYKDGSFFTPSHVTHFMAARTIEKSLLKKISLDLGEEFSSLADVQNYIGRERIRKQKINEIVDNFKVCDPAVGSGHFLVSALNVLLEIKFKLNLIYTDDGVSLGNLINLDVVNDEVVVTDELGNYYVYNPQNKKSQLIQSAIFNAKKKIIENSLFGVDINEKSVQICRLRLWIELLKNSYYLDNQLQTMPNIDINIKKGNSLVNRYPIALGKAAKTLPDDIGVLKQVIKEYRENVKLYKNDSNKHSKQQIESTIRDIKYSLGLKRQFELDFWGDGKEQPANESMKPIYQHSLEWMLEFPEVLSEDGKFHGFDVVLVNPPYIDSEAMKLHLEEEREFYRKHFSTTKGNWDIYIPFLERCYQLLSKSGCCCCITPDKWLSKQFGEGFRGYIANHISSVYRFGRDVFENAIVDSIVSEFERDKVVCCLFGDYKNGDIDIINKVSSKGLSQDPFDCYFSKDETLRLGLALKDNVGSYALCESACATSNAYELQGIIEDRDFVSEKDYILVNTGTLDKYTFLWGCKPIKYLKTNYSQPVVNRQLFATKFANKAYERKTLSKKIIIKGLTKLDAALDLNGNVIPGKSTVVVLSEDISTLKVLAAFINSSFAIEFLKQKYPSATYNGGLNFTHKIIASIPIPPLNHESRLKIEQMVDSILNSNSIEKNSLIELLDQYISKLYRG